MLWWDGQGVSLPGRFEVVCHVLEAFSCRSCESVVQAPAPHNASPAVLRPGIGLWRVFFGVE